MKKATIKEHFDSQYKTNKQKTHNFKERNWESYKMKASNMEAEAEVRKNAYCTEVCWGLNKIIHIRKAFIKCLAQKVVQQTDTTVIY